MVGVYAHMSIAALVAGSTGLGAFLGVQMYGQPHGKPHRYSKGGGLRKWRTAFSSSVDRDPGLEQACMCHRQLLILLEAEPWASLGCMFS